MTKIRFYLCLLLFLYSCAEGELPGFKYSFFENTPVNELALAVKDDDPDRINLILKDKSIPVDYQEKKFGNSLLTIAIVNQKKNAFLALLENGADPNLRSLDVGKNISSTPFITACMSGGYDPFFCDTYYMEKLLEYGADPNSYEIRITPDGSEHKVSALMIAISKKSEIGESCMKPLKLLLEHGAEIDVYSQEEGYGIFSELIADGNLDIVKYLIVDCGVEVPDTIYVRRKGLENEQALSMSDLLLESKYSHSAEKRKYKSEILDYLESIGKR